MLSFFGLIWDEISSLRSGMAKGKNASEKQIPFGDDNRNSAAKQKKQRQRRMRGFRCGKELSEKVFSKWQQEWCESLSVDVVGPGALGGGVCGGAQAGEGVEVVGEVGLVVVAAGEGELGPVDVGAAVDELDGLLEALDAAVEFGGDADLFAEELGEAARADADVAGEAGDGGGAGGVMEAGEGVVDGGGSALGFAFAEAVAEGEVEEVEFSMRVWGFAEVVAEVLGGAAPEGCRVRFRSW